MILGCLGARKGLDQPDYCRIERRGRLALRAGVHWLPRHGNPVLRSIGVVLPGVK
jgi:hypothetical protein